MSHSALPSSGKKKPLLEIQWQILIALILATVLGLVLPKDGMVAGVNVPVVCQFVGKLFLRALQMLVVPLILSSLICAIARLGQEGAFGRLGLRSMVYYLSTVTAAILTGLFLVNIIKPGVVSPEISHSLISSIGNNQAEVVSKVSAHSGSDLWQVFVRMIPENIVHSASSNREMLALIFFGFLFGYYITKLPSESREPYVAFWENTYSVMLFMTDCIVKFTPIGVFGLMTATVFHMGSAVLGPLVAFACTVTFALGTQIFILLPLILWFFGWNPFVHFKMMAPALFTAFSTASSSATVPTTMECLEKHNYIPKKITQFSIPLGATVNLDGTALYECVAAIFIAQIYGVELSFAKQVLVVILALLTSIGVAGIPAASLVAIVIILEAVGLPAEAIGIILATDRILDMCRTTVNLFSDSCAAAVVAGTEGYPKMSWQQLKDIESGKLPEPIDKDELATS